MMKKINVVGTSGTGKSTFSKKLAEELGITYIEMDLIFWQKDWTEPEDDIFFKKLSAAMQGENWVLDGNYSRTNSIKWAQPATVIWLDYSFLRTFFQVVFRSVNRAITKKELWPGTGNRESFHRTFFSEKSIILWMLTNYKKTRLKYKKIMKSGDYPHINFVHLKSPAEAEKFIQSVKKQPKKPRPAKQNF